MGSNQIDHLLELVPVPVMISFFHRKKTAISSNIHKPLTFLHQLQDHDLITKDLYQKVLKARSKEKMQQGLRNILTYMEKQGEKSIKQFWTCVSETHMLKKYPFLYSLFSKLQCSSLLEDAKKLKGSGEKKAGQKKRPNKRKRDIYETEEEPHTSSVSRSSQKSRFSLPIKREKKEDIWALSKTIPVTCGDKEGILYPDKLVRGEVCILSQGSWFTPNSFETFSGRGNWKNWKHTIYSQNTPLLKLLKEGHLQCPRKYRRYGQKEKAVSFVENSSSVSDVKTNKSRKVLKKWIKEENNEQEEDGENDSEPVDLSNFDAPALPVSCGSVSGILYKSRFVGLHSKSIRTEERWFNPEEFVKQGVTQTDGHWKKDILCHGKTLNYLVKKKILYIHSLLCSCDLCSLKNQLELDNDDVCYICNTGGKLVCCDGCPRAFHPDCHLSTLQEDTTVRKWLCTFCVLKANNELWTRMSLKAAVQSPVSENIMRCEYLLLNLYKEDSQRVFTDDPIEQVANYSRVISNPMWLNRVKSKLQNKEYETMRQFVCDVLLIFKNCKKFNKDNKFGKMGDRLSKIFVQDFYTIFKIIK